jgi:hypothetical protein
MAARGFTGIVPVLHDHGSTSVTLVFKIDAEQLMIEFVQWNGAAWGERGKPFQRRC